MIWASNTGSARGFAAAVAAAMFCGTAVAGPVVIRATGPSAGAYPAGRKLADNALLGLKAGDTLVLLDSRGTRTLSGPGNFPAVGTSMRAGTAQTAARILANTGAAERRGGAVRGPGLTADTRSPNLWLVDLTKSGTVCVADANSVRVWRGDSDKAAAIKVSAAAGSGTISLPAGATIGEWPKSAPITDGAEYMVVGDGVASTAVKFMTVTPPANVEDTASLLIAKGCKAQLDLLIATTGSDGRTG